MKTTQIILILTVLLTFSSCEEEADKTLSFDNVPLSYIDQGIGEPSVVFVHGWITDKSYWENQIDYFKKNHRVVAIDLAGHGNSGSFRKNWNPENFARDIVAVINDLEMENVVVVGHSISEEAIVRAARMEPRKIIGLVGVDNFKTVDLDFNDSIQQEAEKFFALMHRNFPITAEFYATEFLFTEFTPRAVQNRLFRSIQEADTSVAIPMLQLLYTDYQEEKKFLKELVHPLYLINSSYTPTDTVALAKYCNHGYILETIPDVGHYNMLEAPDKFNEILGKYLAQIKESDFKPN